ncbi:MAG: hypothetical protein GX258_08940 [Clostridiales bacterium]|mgnify:CR=1 FL=1|jgi:hypothetical protein|nr:hypothetical protein [Clostridiales bacterium]
MSKIEINAAQMKFIREFFDNYEDEKVKFKVIDTSNRIKTTYEVETDLSDSELEKYVKKIFKEKSKYGSSLYYTVKLVK